MIVTTLSLAALSHQDGAETVPHPHYLSADEVQSFIHGVDFPTILSEARKYRLTLVIATQTLAQLPPACLAAVFGNCATVVSFRVGGEDAKVLREEFSTAIAASQLQDLPDYKSYVRTLMGGRPTGLHLVNTFPPAEETGEETPAGASSAPAWSASRGRGRG